MFELMRKFSEYKTLKGYYPKVWCLGVGEYNDLMLDIYGHSKMFFDSSIGDSVKFMGVNIIIEKDTDRELE